MPVPESHSPSSDRPSDEDARLDPPRHPVILDCMKRRTLAKLLSASAVLTVGGLGYTARARTRNPYDQGPVTGHFDGARFFNPGQPTDKGLGEFLRFQFGGRRMAWPDHYPSPFADTPPHRVAGLRVVLVGHASVLIQVSGLNILIDPV